MFIPAFLEDNAIGVSQDPDYETRLMKRDPTLARALRFGDWSVFSGQAIREFNKSIHVCKPFEIPSHWLRWRSVDWGFAMPWSVHWFAMDPDKRRLFVYRELYKTGITDPQQARMIRETSGPEEMFTFTFADPSMWSRKSDTDQVKTTNDVYAQNGVLLARADNDHRSKLSKCHTVLKLLPDGLPNVQIFDGMCPNLVRTLPALMSDPKNPEDILEGQEEHAFDSFTYGLTNWRDPFPQVTTRKPKPPNPWDNLRNI